MRSTDIAILGGGLAGLTLALQLRQALPDAGIRVVDRRIRPRPERTGSVGESFSEVGAHYLREVVGLRDHLDARHLPKFGLRFFVGSDPDFANRFELGLLDPRIAGPTETGLPGLPLPSHQVDRGRLENELLRRCEAAGVEVLEGHEVRGVALARTRHRVELSPPDASFECRWVVNAGGGDVPGLPDERIDLGHRVEAAWLRVEGELDVGRWSDCPEYRERTLPGFRRLSTNHLMGRGYWIWLIPLPSGVTSVGVVADPAVVDFPVRDRATLLEWLAPRDARLHGELSAAPPAGDGEFHRTSLRARAAATAFGEERWAVVGRAAAAVDVLYSPGADLIAVGNTLATDLIRGDLSGGPARTSPRLAERFFKGFVHGVADLYRGQYRHFGDAGLVGSKVLWDSALYFGFNTLLFRHGLFGKPAFFAQIRPELTAVQALQNRVQARFRDGTAHPVIDPDGSPVEWGGVRWMMDNYYGARDQDGAAGVVRQLRAGIATLEGVARSIEGVSA